jgi:hypothetical protein
MKKAAVSTAAFISNSWFYGLPSFKSDLSYNIRISIFRIPTKNQMPTTVVIPSRRNQKISGTGS